MDFCDCENDGVVCDVVLDCVDCVCWTKVLVGLGYFCGFFY